MDVRQITPDYSVSPQIDPEDMRAIAEAGFVTVICNRPDAENPPTHQVDAMQAAAREAGLAFVTNPVTHPTIALAQAGGPVLAYCASGTRSSVLWALGQSGHIPADAILEATGKAGYDLSGLRPSLEG